MINEINGKYTILYKINYDIKDDIGTIEDEVRTYLGLNQNWMNQTIDECIGLELMNELEEKDKTDYEISLDKAFNIIFEKAIQYKHEYEERKEELDNIYKVMGREIIFEKTINILTTQDIPSESIEEFGKEIWQSLPYFSKLNILIETEQNELSLTSRDKELLYNRVMANDQITSLINTDIIEELNLCMNEVRTMTNYLKK